MHAAASMDPRSVSPEQWEQISRVLIHLFLFTGLALNGALAFLLGHAIIPPLGGGPDAPQGFQSLRRVLYPVFAASLALTVYALARALSLALDVLRYIYPRFLI